MLRMLRNKKEWNFALFVFFALSIFMISIPSEALEQEIQTIPAQPEITDISGYWAEEVLDEWMGKGWVTGYIDNTFRPNNPITRAEFMTLTNKAFGYEAEGAVSFTDVAEDAWYAGAVKKAAAAGYIGGYPDGTVRPNNPISRQEAAVIITKIAGLPDNPEGSGGFNDAASIPVWSRGAIGATAAAGYMGGYPDGTFKPVSNITRAEAVTALNKTLLGMDADTEVQSIFEKAGTYGPEAGTQTITGDVWIKAPGITLQNMTITGNLYITEEVGEGDVTLNDIIVVGDTYIRGGGTDSIYINGGEYNRIIIQKTKDGIRVIAIGTRGAAVFIEKETRDNEVILEGDFESITVLAEGVTITTRGNTNIKNLTIDENAQNVKVITSQDTIIDRAVINTNTDFDNKGRIMTATGTAARASLYETNLPENLLPRRTSSDGGSSAPPTPPPLEISMTVSPDQVEPSAAFEQVFILTIENDTVTGTVYREDITLGGVFAGLDTKDISKDISNTTVTMVIYGGEAEFGTGTITLSAEVLQNSTEDLSVEITVSYFDGGTGTVQAPYQVATAGQLNNVRNHLDKYFVQTVDINLEDYSDGDGWEPIGTSGDGGSPFTGSYDGDGFSISNLTIDSNQNGIGLFGRISGPGEIHNVSLINVDISGVIDVGSLVGYNAGGVVTGSNATGSVSGNSYVGGLVGNNNSGTISTSYATGEVEGTSFIGGLVGVNWNNAIVIDSYAIGDVKGDGDQNGYVGGLVGSNNSGTISDSYAAGEVTGEANVGGLVGYNYAGTITTSYATGEVEGSSHAVGGLVGVNWENATVTGSYATGEVMGIVYVGGLVGNNNSSTISTSYATGLVSGTSHVGGLVGYNDAGTGTISTSYATGLVSGTSYIGGLVGHNTDDTTVTNSYWDTDTSRQDESAGGVGHPTSAMTMQSNSVNIYEGWDVNEPSSVWNIIVGESYPYLKWQGTENIPYPPIIAPTSGSFDVTNPPGTTVVTITSLIDRNGTDVLSGFISDDDGSIYTIQLIQNAAPHTEMTLTKDGAAIKLVNPSEADGPLSGAYTLTITDGITIWEVAITAID